MKSRTNSILNCIFPQRETMFPKRNKTTEPSANSSAQGTIACPTRWYPGPCYATLRCSQWPSSFFFSAKGGVLAYFSPYTLMNKRNLDYNKNCKFSFGSFVQANQENIPSNNNRLCTIDCIYLRPILEKSRGHELMNLTTGAVLVRPRMWEMPFTEHVIRSVESLAKSQGTHL